MSQGRNEASRPRAAGPAARTPRGLVFGGLLVVALGGGVWWMTRGPDVAVQPGPTAPAGPAAAGSRSPGTGASGLADPNLGASPATVPLDEAPDESPVGANGAPGGGDVADDEGGRRPRSVSAATKARIAQFVAAGLSEREADDCQRAFRRVGRAETATHDMLASLLPTLPDLLAKGQIALLRPGSKSSVVGVQAVYVPDRKVLEVTVRRPGGDLLWSIPDTVGDPEKWRAVRDAK